MVAPQWTEHCPTCGRYSLHCFEQPCGYKKCDGRIVPTDTKTYQTCWHAECGERGRTVEYGKKMGGAAMNFNYFTMVNGVVIPRLSNHAEIIWDKCPIGADVSVPPDVYAEYAEYVKRAEDEGVDAMSIDQWRSTVAEWNSLNSEFEALERLYGVGTVWEASKGEADRLCEKMAELEFWLLR